MITKQKSLDLLLQETSTLQQNKDLHIIQKPKNLVLGLTMLRQVVKQKLAPPPKPAKSPEELAKDDYAAKMKSKGATLPKGF